MYFSSVNDCSQANDLLLELPAENTIISITPSGSSYWARTAKIETETPEGEEASYFIKVRDLCRECTM